MEKDLDCTSYSMILISDVLSRPRCLVGKNVVSIFYGICDGCVNGRSSSSMFFRMSVDDNLSESNSSLRFSILVLRKPLNLSSRSASLFRMTAMTARVA